MMRHWLLGAVLAALVAPSAPALAHAPVALVPLDPAPVLQAPLRLEPPGADLTPAQRAVILRAVFVKAAACPQGSSLGDGCPGLGGNFIQANFSAHARQSGQTWKSPHPWLWNAPGVDYPVGYYTPTAGLKDPTTAALPTGCVYSATASLLGGPKVTCSAVAGLTITGYDFSLHGCVPLDIKNSVTGTIAITDNRFVNGPNCSVTDAVGVGSISATTLTVASISSGAIVNSASENVQGGVVINSGTIVSFTGTGTGGAGTYGLSRSWTDAGPTTYTFGRTQGYLLEVENGSAASEDIENNYFDGVGATLPLTLNAEAVLDGTGAETVKYNVFLHCPCRPLAGASRGPILVEYNYFEDYVYNFTDGHGEVIANVPAASITIPSYQYSYNVALEGSGVLALGGTANYWLAGGATSNTFTLAQADHNIGITNLSGGTRVTSGAVAETQSSTYTNITFSNNYSDPTGALYSFYTSNATCTNPTSFSGNVLLTTGASVNAYQSNTSTGC